MITKNQLINLYGRWLRRDPYIQKALEHAAKSIYPKVVKECTYEWKGKRHWCVGSADAITQQIQGSFQAFVKAWERGHMTFALFDAVIWAVHNHGVLANKFISDCPTEEQAIEFLNELGGISRRNG